MDRDAEPGGEEGVGEIEAGSSRSLVMVSSSGRGVSVPEATAANISSSPISRTSGLVGQRLRDAAPELHRDSAPTIFGMDCERRDMAGRHDQGTGLFAAGRWLRYTD